ncbi:virulence-associated E family protein, partial [[Eubacterium] rectale]|uniref:VapE domain-containing protein n=2 Tax=Bacillota TaxID=1239 RepID=UPI0027D26FA8
IGKDWFSNSLESFDGKEAAELLQGVWIVEIGEMSAYNKSDLNTIKGFLSRTDDQYRAAYARKAEKHLRRCVFFG